MENLYEKAAASAAYLKERLRFAPKIAVVLGSGLGDLTAGFTGTQEIPYESIPHFPQSTVAGHKGALLEGMLGDTPVLAMEGRFHFYEGYSMKEVCYPFYVFKLLGVETVVLTNAAGGVNRSFDAGDLMLITDHIAVFVPNPLIGPNIEELGTRFPDMSHIYDPALCGIIRSVAAENSIPLREGVYCQLTGPSYESPAEIRALAALGADAVGMSTAVEAVAANHCGMRVCGISCVSNKAAGLSPTPLSHKEVQEAADKAAPLFTKLVRESIAAFGK